MKLRTVLLIGVLVVAACSGDDDAQTSTTTAETRVSAPSSTAPSTEAPTSSTPVTSTTASPEATVGTTTDPSTTVASTTVPPPTTVNTKVDWRQVVEDLGRQRQAIYGEPDVNRVTDACIAGSPCADQMTVQIADLADKRWRVVEADPYTVLSADVEAFDGGDTPDAALLVTLIVVVERPQSAGRIVYVDGATVAAVEAETPEGSNTENRTVLSRAGSRDGPWRIVSQERLREVPA